MKHPSRQFHRSRRPTIQRAELMEIIRTEPSLHGEVGLWLYLLLDVIETLQKEPQTRQDFEDRELARRFIQERGGVFDHTAHVFGYDPDDLRRKLFKASG